MKRSLLCWFVSNVDSCSPISMSLVVSSCFSLPLNVIDDANETENLIVYWWTLNFLEESGFKIRCCEIFIWLEYSKFLSQSDLKNSLELRQLKRLEAKHIRLQTIWNASRTCDVCLFFHALPYPCSHNNNASCFIIVILTCSSRQKQRRNEFYCRQAGRIIPRWQECIGSTCIGSDKF